MAWPTSSRAGALRAHAPHRPVSAADAAGRPYVLATFHGDTEGLQSPGVLEALHATVGRMDGAPSLLFGLDANTYEKAVPGKTQDVLEFAADYVERGLTFFFNDTAYT